MESELKIQKELKSKKRKNVSNQKTSKKKPLDNRNNEKEIKEVLVPLFTLLNAYDLDGFKKKLKELLEKYNENYLSEFFTFTYKFSASASIKTTLLIQTITPQGLAFTSILLDYDVNLSKTIENQANSRLINQLFILIRQHPETTQQVYELFQKLNFMQSTQIISDILTNLRSSYHHTIAEIFFSKIPTEMLFSYVEQKLNLLRSDDFKPTAFRIAAGELDVIYKFSICYETNIAAQSAEQPVHILSTDKFEKLKFFKSTLYELCLDVISKGQIAKANYFFGVPSNYAFGASDDFKFNLDYFLKLPVEIDQSANKTTYNSNSFAHFFYQPTNNNSSFSTAYIVPTTHCISPLFAAIQYVEKNPPLTYTSIFREILKQNLNINLRSPDRGETALQFSIRNCYVTSAMVLLKCGALSFVDPQDLRNNTFETFLKYEQIVFSVDDSFTTKLHIFLKQFMAEFEKAAPKFNIFLNVKIMIL